MRREDYERLGPATPARACGTEVARFIPSDGREVSLVASSRELPPDALLLELIVHVDRQSLRVGLGMDKEQTDAMIRDLIAARNSLWPTP